MNKIKETSKFACVFFVAFFFRKHSERCVWNSSIDIDLMKSETGN
jgi:hypothetical protein